ncbi:MAG TPA: D-sedoheptulose 7-phosphate isomerase [Elusimicrobiales bacterium]|nr:D-sedoheptulose 7-phosphate isomerase [Elusimicrobiales bacterium]
MEEKIRLVIGCHASAAQALADKWAVIAQIASVVAGTLRKGGRVLVCGNGGSAADSQHIAAELVGRFKLERRALSAIALTTDTSILTSLSNDYSYDQVFARQVEAHGRPGDVVIGLSTSGASPNVLKALQKAREMRLTTVGLLGRDGGVIKPACDMALVIENADTPRVQEMHILAAHIVCELVEASLASD